MTRGVERGREWIQRCPGYFMMVIVTQRLERKWNGKDIRMGEMTGGTIVEALLLRRVNEWAWQCVVMGRCSPLMAIGGSISSAGRGRRRPFFGR